MFLQKAISKKFYKKLVFCWPLEVNDENSRILIRQRHGSADPTWIPPKMSWITNTV
jgi:hypothetical protein